MIRRDRCSSPPCWRCSRPRRSPSPARPFRYRVELARAGDTTVAISIEAPEPLAGPVTLVIPRAVPMGYSQQDYDRYVGDVTARGERRRAARRGARGGPRFRLGADGSEREAG